MALTRERLRPVYTLVGDEVYFRDLFQTELMALIEPGTEDFSRFDEDLATTPLDEILDRARNPSLMAPLQLFFVRNAKDLFARATASAPEEGKKSAKKRKHGDFPANVERFAGLASAGGTAAVVVFLADHLHLPADRARMSLEDKSRLQRIEATLGGCSEIVACGQVPEAKAAALAREMAARQGVELSAEVARTLVAMMDGNLGLIGQEVAKLAAHAHPGREITAAAVAALVGGARAGSSFDLAARLGKGDRKGSLECLARIWAEEGDSGAIGLVFQLSRAMQMALILRQERVRERSQIYQVLPEGLRPPGFAADAILGLGAGMAEAKLKQGIRMLHAADVRLRSNPVSMKLVFEELVLALTKPAAR